LFTVNVFTTNTTISPENKQPTRIFTQCAEKSCHYTFVPNSAKYPTLFCW